MNEIQIFKNREFGNIRVITKKGEPWFIGKDICDALDLSNPTMAIGRLDVDERSKFNLGRQGEANCVNEYGLYNLVLSSRKPEAKEFKRWVTHEILPSIRKTGGYLGDTEGLSELEVLSRAILIAQRNIEEQKKKIAGLSIDNSRLAVDNQIMRPKAEYFDELVDRNLATNFRETAKQLGIKERRFIQFLIDKKYIYRDRRNKIMPYAEKNTGLFEIKECINEKTKWSGTQTVITPKGRETFRLLCTGLV